jgi:hypothetical protein
MNLSYDWSEDGWGDDFMYNLVSEVIDKPLSSSDLIDELDDNFREVAGLVDTMKKRYYFIVKPNGKKWNWEYVETKPLYKGNSVELVTDNGDGTYSVMAVASAFLNSRIMARKVFKKYLKEGGRDERSMEKN